MEIVVQTDYQDIYRITGGVLLIVNKFECDYSYGKYCYLHSAKDKPYNKLTQGLRILKEDTIYNSYGETHIIPKGCVTSHSFPIKPIANKLKWSYEVKTTANCFSGDASEILEMLNDIKNKILGRD